MRKGRFAAVICIILAFGLLLYSREVAQGVRTGIENCLSVLIPSLFPFMCLACLLGMTSAGERLSQMVSPLLRLLGIPQALGDTLFMSFVGGFPVGARMLSGMLDRGEIDRSTAERALCFCVNAGPSFLISAVGAGMLGSSSAGLVLLAGQILSSLTIGAFLFRGRSIPAGKPRQKMGAAQAFVGAVENAGAGMLSICAFVIVFSAISALLNACGALKFCAGTLMVLFPQGGEAFFPAALCGILEVTNGCIAACAMRTHAGFLLTAFLVSFSSLSIIFQVKSCFSPKALLQYKKFYCSRFAHGALTSLFCAAGWYLLPPDAISTAACLVTPVAKAAPNMLVTGLCLMAMCTMLLLRQRPARR